MTNEQLAECIQDGETELIYPLWTRNRPLIYRLIRPYIGLDWAFDESDLMQSAFIGFMSALRDYDGAAGCLFMSYAGLHIKSAVRRSLGLWKERPRCVSLYVPINDDVELLDVLPADLPPIDEAAEIEDIRRIVRESVNKLPPEQSEVIRRHDLHGETLSDIAQSRVTSLAWVCDLRRVGLRKLRRMQSLKSLYIPRTADGPYRHDVARIATDYLAEREHMDNWRGWVDGVRVQMGIG